MGGADDVRRCVSEIYARAVEREKGAANPCCHGHTPEGRTASAADYSPEALAVLPPDAVADACGCGNPVALGEPHEGDTVLDLGSGAGIDLLLAAKLVGQSGKVVGVDMTPAMIERARRNAAEAGLANVEVRLGIVEELPVETASVDLVISNCVLNLSPEKPRVFSEIVRVLRPGGRFSISDVVVEEMPGWVRELGLLYSACLAGAIGEADYLAWLRAAGLVDAVVAERRVYAREKLERVIRAEPLEVPAGCCSGPESLPRGQRDAVIEALTGKVASVRIVGRKPGAPA